MSKPSLPDHVALESDATCSRIVPTIDFDFAEIDRRLGFEITADDAERLADVFRALLDWVFPTGGKSEGIAARAIAVRWILRPMDNSTAGALCAKNNVSPRLFAESVSSFRRTFKIEIGGRGKSPSHREAMRRAALRRHARERKQELDPERKEGECTR